MTHNGFFEIIVNTDVPTDEGTKMIQVSVRSKELDEFGLVCDFHDIRAVVKNYAKSVDCNSGRFCEDLKLHLMQKFKDEAFQLTDVTDVTDTRKLTD